ncbi:amidase [Bacillus sp. B190/17]|uniref:Amidase n=1 Tax=Bacillus lumedeiriae TaxID=3058829 RepID=A0ABW8IBJ3_9BACI
MATWLWETDLIKNDMDHTIQFIKERQIQTVYLQYHSQIQNSTYKKFIAAVNKMGVHVYALDGGSDWGMTNQEKEKQFLNRFIDYQTSAQKKEQFQGIHLDVEPYLLDDWKTNQDERVLQYQSLIVRMKEAAKHMNTRLGVDIPFWYDKVLFKNENGHGILSQWVIQNVDEITVMAYRNFARGKNGIIDISTKEVEWAEQEGKRIYIAVETKELPEEHTSFYGKDIHTLSEELEIVTSHFDKRISGIAIHHFNSWQKFIHDQE